VLFDVVWNHLSDVDNRLWEFDGMTREGGVFFEGGERSPWGPRLATWKQEVRDLIVANARMWLEEYHADGLRIDAANEIARDALAAAVHATRNEPAGPSKLLIAEWTGDDVASWDVLVDELGFDRVWSLADPYHFRAAVDDAAGDVAFRTEQLASIIDLPNGAARVRYLLGSHDDAHDNEHGERAGHRHFIELAGGRDDPTARAKSRLGWALCVALPGTPMCFMGAECHQPGYWHPRTDNNPAHGDHRFDWSLCGDASGTQMRALVAAANKVRWDEAGLRSRELYLIHVDRNNGVLAFVRPAAGSGSVLVIVNVSGTGWPDGGYRIPMPGDATTWRVILDSEAAAYGGAGWAQPDAVANDGTISVTVPPWSVVMLVPAD